MSNNTMRILATTSLATDIAGRVISLAPGDTAELPTRHAQALITAGHALAATEPDHAGGQDSAPVSRRGRHRPTEAKRT